MRAVTLCSALFNFGLAVCPSITAEPASLHICSTFNGMLYLRRMGTSIDVDGFIEHWKHTGGSELANTQSFGRIDCYRRDCFILEAKQGSEGDRAAGGRGEDDLDLFGQTASARLKRGTARRGTPGWAKAMVQAKGQAERYAKARCRTADRADQHGAIAQRLDGRSGGRRGPDRPRQARRRQGARRGVPWQAGGHTGVDPACGTGNFLYVAMARMKELESEVLELLAELGDHQYVAGLTGHTITPENFLGIEINPRAAAIAQLVLWIGYLQWHFRVNGADRAPPEPILKDTRLVSLNKERAAEEAKGVIRWLRPEYQAQDNAAPVTQDLDFGDRAVPLGVSTSIRRTKRSC